MPVLDRQPAAGTQGLRRAGDDGAQRREPVRAGPQRRRRLEAQVPAREVRIVLGHVGRVGDHEREALAAGRAEPVGVTQLDPPGCETGDVARRDFERRGAGVARDHLPVPALQGEGEGDRAAAGADVQRTHGLRRRQVEGELDQALGLRARDERRRRHLELEGPEGAPPGEVGDGLAAGAPGDEREVALPGRRRDASLGPDQSLVARLAGRVREEHLGVGARLGAGPADRRDRILEELAEGRLPRLVTRDGAPRHRVRSRAPRAGPRGPRRGADR